MQFHILSFEGPDSYSRAGGIATRINGLSRALADSGFETHLWFVGDPYSPGHQGEGNLRLHRWCQWISQYHPTGVYDGEEGKCCDYARSLPPFLMSEELLPHLRRGGRAVILAEEWQTVNAVLHLDWLLKLAGLRKQVTILWNANNTFCFERIDWKRLSQASVITTVSRYMKHLMCPLGVDPMVIPNGLSAEALLMPQCEIVSEFRKRLAGRMVISKMARWDPDKRWLAAIDIVSELKRAGWKPLLLARGGVEAYGTEVLGKACASGLRVVEGRNSRPGPEGLLEALEGAEDADVVSLSAPVDVESRRVLFCGSSAVLANSSHEPFGLVGLETMAVGGVACTGCTGEDYAVPGENALILKTDDPREFTDSFRALLNQPLKEESMRRAARSTAEHYAWPRVLQDVLLPFVHRLPGASQAQQCA